MLSIFSNVRSEEKGFSLVELMVVVGIIGILATLAVPRFQTFQAKARMSEAKIMLGQIASLQDTYYNDNSTYITFAAYGKSSCTQPGPAVALGFTIATCNTATPRFQYSATIVGATPSSQYNAVADTTTANAVCASAAAGQVRMTEARAFTYTGTGFNTTTGNCI